MANFCTQCGRPLADGEICQCQMARNQQAGNQQNQYYNNGPQMGGQPGQERGPVNPNEGYTISTEDWIPLRKLIGIGEADNNDVEGCFERGKKIVPDLIAPCEQ